MKSSKASTRTEPSGSEAAPGARRQGRLPALGSLAGAYRRRREQQRAAWQATKNSIHIGMCFAFGVPLLLAALFFQTVTVANGSYNSVLTIALVLTVVADVFFVKAFRRGGVMVRSVSVLLLLPTIYIVIDFLRRTSSLLD